LRNAPRDLVSEYWVQGSPLLKPTAGFTTIKFLASTPLPTRDYFRRERTVPVRPR
jgi:hypothetical protein